MLDELFHFLVYLLLDSQHLFVVKLTQKRKTKKEFSAYVVLGIIFFFVILLDSCRLPTWKFASLSSLLIFNEMSFFLFIINVIDKIEKKKLKLYCSVDEIELLIVKHW